MRIRTESRLLQSDYHNNLTAVDLSPVFDYLLTRTEVPSTLLAWS
jgi:hypothetical protein